MPSIALCLSLLSLNSVGESRVLSCLASARIVKALGIFWSARGHAYVRSYPSVKSRRMETEQEYLYKLASDILWQILLSSILFLKHRLDQTTIEQNFHWEGTHNNHQVQLPAVITLHSSPSSSTYTYGPFIWCLHSPNKQKNVQNLRLQN